MYNCILARPAVFFYTLLKMANQDKRPQIVDSKLEDFPTKAVAEYFISKSRGIFKHSGTSLKWDEVPRSAPQQLVCTLHNEDVLKKECGDAQAECSQREKKLEEQWNEIRDLEVQLKQAFVSTEEKIKALTSTHGGTDKIGSVSNEKSVEEKIEVLKNELQLLHEKKTMYDEETGRASIAIQELEAQMSKLQPYMDFAAEVAKARPELYTDGPLSVLQQYEKLQATQKEITNSQENTLREMEELRKQTQKFTTEALVRLDIIQGKIQEKKEQVAIQENSVIQKEASMQAARDQLKVNAGEVEKMEESIKCLYEQLWKRYHGNSSTAPEKDVSGQTKYIELVLTALANLANDLRTAEPNDDESIEHSQCEF